MKICIGTNRIVILLPWLGIVLKIALIKMATSIRIIHRRMVRGHWMALKKEIVVYTTESHTSIKQLLLKGLLENWREYKFYRKTKSQFLVETYFSLFGFLNIQRLAPPCKLRGDDLWNQLLELTEGDAYEDSHHFENPENFSLNGRNLQILDYGGLKVQGIISKYEPILIRQFNPNYSWDGEMKY